MEDRVEALARVLAAALDNTTVPEWNERMSEDYREEFREAARAAIDFMETEA